MKKTLSLLLSLATLTAFSQNVRNGGWAEQFMVGANVNVTSTWMLNNAINQLPDGQSDQEFSLGYSVGVAGGYHYNQHIGVAVDVHYFKLNQRYSGKENSLFWESDVSVSGFQIPVYGKFMTRSGFFAEVGWQFGFITSAKYKRSMVSSSEGPLDADVRTNFTKVIYSPHLGIGMDWYLNDMWVVTTGIRANYGINNIKGVDGMGRDLSTDPLYTDPQPTNPLAVGLFVGFRYMIDAGGRY